jgi:hypothetical protein
LLGGERSGGLDEPGSGDLLQPQPLDRLGGDQRVGVGAVPGQVDGLDLRRELFAGSEAELQAGEVGPRREDVRGGIDPAGVDLVVLEQLRGGEVQGLPCARTVGSRG